LIPPSKKGSFDIKTETPVEYLTQLYTAGGMGPRRNSFSGFDAIDKASQ